MARMKRLLQGLFLAYLAVLPIAETIALRNVLLLSALLVLGYFFVFHRRAMAVSPAFLMDRRFIPLVVWAVFLVLFPLWAQEPAVAWDNLRGQWALSLLAWFVGIGVVMTCGVAGPGVGHLAMASGFILLIHLLSAMLAWSGALGSNVPRDLPLPEMLERLQATWRQGGGPWVAQPFPWGFRGFDPMHGNLGYSSSQAIGLLCGVVLVGWLRARKVDTLLAATAIVLSFGSVLVATSRGAMIYDLVLLVFAVVGSVYVARGKTVAAGAQWKHRLPALLVLGAMTAAITLLLTSTIRNDARWSSLVAQVRVAWMVQDPVAFLCKGMSDEMRGQLKGQLQDLSPAYADSLIDGLEHDGVRVILMRAGWHFVVEHPGGLDGSRHSFKKLLASDCDQSPALPFAHSHNGWFDTALALGWVGAALLFFLLAYAGLLAWRQMRLGNAQPWALALVLLSFFWLIRGLLDSVYREHYLQMQGAVLGYLLARLLLQLNKQKTRLE